MRLYLIRHGQTSWNVDKRAQGHTDIPLDATGEIQAERLAQAMAGIKIERLLTSDLQRAHQTAEAISKVKNIPLEVSGDLRERSFGDWEGNPYAEIGIKFQFIADMEGKSRDEVIPPNGESFADVWARLAGIYDSVVAHGVSTGIVCHGGTASILMAMFLGGGVEIASAFRFSNASINELEPRPGGAFRLVRYNDVAHLAGVAVMSGVANGTR
jgi:2,3-bisphosphoglycerate-dependent phosphoglycerate mutase